MWRRYVVYIVRIRRSAEFQALCEVYEFFTDRQIGKEKADYAWHRGFGSAASGIGGHIRNDLTFLLNNIKKSQKGACFQNF